MGDAAAAVKSWASLFHQGASSRQERGLGQRGEEGKEETRLKRATLLRAPVSLGEDATSLCINFFGVCCEASHTEQVSLSMPM